MIKTWIEKLKALRIYAVIGSSIDKHDCRESREVIDKLPLLEGDSYMSPPKYYFSHNNNLFTDI